MKNTANDSLQQRRYHTALTTGRWKTTTLAEAAKSINQGASISTLISALDLLSASTGISDELLDTLCASSAPQDSRLAHRCEAIALSSGRLDLAESLHHHKTLRAHRDLARWPSLLTRRDRVPFWLTSTRKNARRLLRRTVSIECWLAARRAEAGVRQLKIALVGNAPCALSGHRGASIDACDIVVRFNNGLPDPSNYDHIGQRTDLHVVSPGAVRLLTRQQRIVPDSAIALTANSGWTRPSRYWQTVARHSTGPVVSLAPQAWTKLVQALEAPPSAGIMMRQMMSTQPGVTALVHGFDPQGLARGATNHHKDTIDASTRHDFVREAQWIAKHLPRVVEN